MECSPNHHAINNRNDGVNNAPTKVTHSLIYINFFISLPFLVFPSCGKYTLSDFLALSSSDRLLTGSLFRSFNHLDNPLSTNHTLVVNLIQQTRQHTNQCVEHMTLVYSGGVGAHSVCSFNQLRNVVLHCVHSLHGSGPESSPSKHFF